MIALVMTLGIMMVSTIRHSSFKGAGPHRRNPRLIIILITVVIAGVWFYSQWMLLILASLYALHGIAGKLWSMTHRRSSTAVAEQTDLNEHPLPR
jgi:phosphatidylserine synthase